MGKPNRLTGMWFYDYYNGISGRIGAYLGAGFYLEHSEQARGPGVRIFNLGNLLRSGRFFDTEEERDQWLTEKANYRNPDYDIIEMVTGVKHDNSAVQ